MKCPTCGCQLFFVKDPDDEYEIYEYEVREGSVVPRDEADAQDCPEIRDDTEIYCDRCAWHGAIRELDAK
jgi:hypothetical protein